MSPYMLKKGFALLAGHPSLKSTWIRISARIGAWLHEAIQKCRDWGLMGFLVSWWIIQWIFEMKHFCAFKVLLQSTALHQFRLPMRIWSRTARTQPIQFKWRCIRLSRFSRKQVGFIGLCKLPQRPKRMVPLLVLSCIFQFWQCMFPMNLQAKLLDPPLRSALAL